MLTTKGAIRTAGFMMFATLIAKILGMLRDVLLASYYGTGSEAVAFLTAVRIPILFFDIGLGAAITSTFIPIFNEYLERDGKEKAIEFSNNFVNMVLLVTGLLTVVGILFSDQLVGIIASGLNQQTHELTVKLVRILFPMIVFTGLAFSLVGVLQSFNEFNIPAIISLASNLFVIFYFISLDKYFGIYGLAVAMLIGWLLQVLIQVPSLVKKGYTYSFKLNFMHEGLQKVFNLMVPVLISTWVQPINTMVNIRLASYLNEGKAVAALDYANKLYVMIVGVFVYGLTNLIFPSLSRISAGNDMEQLAKLINRALKTVLFFVFPLMVGVILLRVPLIRFIYERGEFDQFSTQLTSIALLFYSMGMVAFSIQEVLNKVFYAMQDSKTPMKIAVLGIIVNVLLSIILVRFLGVGGLALAGSLAIIFIVILLLISACKRVPGILNAGMLKELIKIIIALAVMSVAVVMVKQLVESHVIADNIIGKALLLGVPGVAGIITYAAAAFVLRIEEIQIFMSIFNKSGRM
ncbi:MAG: murein biosynthesis integral membrane protein MurJ [Clostridiaceae bacterium]|nr:murein biosynthesis integral membrane protein MurJ [Clostridiaceae bacterium]